MGWQITHPAPLPVVAVDPALQAGLASRRGAAQEVAQEWVTAWLSTPASRVGDLAQWWPGQVQLPQVPSSVSWTSVVDAVAAAPGVWSITVAATVTAPKAKAAAREFFAVPVGVTGTTGSVGASVMGLPSPVPGPGGAELPNGGYDQVLAVTTPVSQAVQAFLSAMLTDSGDDLTRYVRPGVPIVAVTPAPYAAVTVQSVTADQTLPGVTDGAAPADGEQVRILAAVLLAQTPADAAQSGAGLSAQYALTLTARAGRWEISAIDPAPVLAATPPTASVPAPATP